MFNFESDFSLSDLLKIDETEKCQEFPLSLQIKSGSGCYVFDENGNRFLDITSNNENQPLGYSCISGDLANNFLDSGLFQSTEAIKLEQNLRDITGLEKSCFASSRAECYKILNSMIQNYLNKTQKNKILISSSARDYFPINGMESDFIPINKDTIAKSLFTKAVGAVVVELVQTNEEIIIADTDYLRYLRDLCDKNNAILVFDVSLISPLRLTKGFFNYDISLKPDVVVISKGISHGLPFGAVVSSGKPDSLKNLKTGTTTLAYQIASKFIEDYKTADLEKIVSSNARYFEKSLNELAECHISILDIQSYGMLYTITLDISAYELAKQGFAKGIILETINSKTIKLSPPYIISKEEIDRFVNVLDSLFDKLAEFDRLK